MKLATLCGCVCKCLRHHFRADSTSGHFVFELPYAFAGFFRYCSEWVETGIYHLEQILSHQFACSRHLRKCKYKRVEAVTVAHRDVTNLL